MKRIHTKIGFIVPLLLLATSYLLLATPASAADISLGIYPPVIQINATPPTDIKSPFTVTNLSKEPVDVQILVRPFTASQTDNGQPQYLLPGQRIGEDPNIFQNMSIFDGEKNTDEISLAPSQKKNLELRIHLPKGEPPSDYYFSITFLSNPIAIGQASGAHVAGGVSTNVLLSIGPQDATTGFVKDFASPLFIDHGPVPFTVHVANTSKHFISPQGTILVKNMFGQIIGKINLKQENILAGTNRYLTDDGVQSSIVNSNLSTNHPSAIWGEHFLLGLYAATLTIALSGEGPLYKRTIYFFALPLQVLIGIILGIILLSIIVYRVKKQLVHT